MALETRIYQKEHSLKLGTLLKESVTAIYTSRFLSKQLAVRDIKAQYRQSYFGIIWAFVTPLTTAFVWIFLNKSGVIKLTDTGIPYPVYAFSGTLLWSMLMESINMPAGSTKGAQSILSKINFPKEALIVSGFYKMIFNSFIKIILLLGFLLIFDVGLHWSLLLFPFALLGMVIFGITIGLFLTPIGMLYNDIAKIISLGFSFIMYATPVVYAIPETGFIKTIMEWNPFTALIVTTRDLAVGLHSNFIGIYFWIIGICIPLFFVALLFYRISIPILVERMNA